MLALRKPEIAFWTVWHRPTMRSSGTATRWRSRRPLSLEGAVTEGAGFGFDVSSYLLHIASGAPCPSSIASRNSSSISGSGRG